MSNTIELDKPVQFVKGVGPARAGRFEALGIRTVGELIEHFPARYDLIPRSEGIGRLQLNRTATIIGRVRQAKRSQGRFGPLVTAQIEDGTGRCRATWFNAAYVADQIRVGETVRLTGRVEVFRDLASFTNPRFEIVDPKGDPIANERDVWEPVYPATTGMNSKQIARIIREVLPQVVDRIDDPLPDGLRKRRNLPPRRTAVQRYHQPVTADDLPVARGRLAYDELLLHQLTLRLRRQHLSDHEKAAPIHTTPKIDERIRARLPFTLTKGQDQAVQEIVADLAGTKPMNRLLQADVGAGKTAVAVYAALVAVANRRQVAILAPTEILAEQHYRKISQYLAGSKVRIAYLVGGQSKSERAKMLTEIAEGTADLVIGTHAVIQKSVQFAKLGLVIIDEQHRFGVAQRAALRAKGRSPHCLVLTATPIPRTLAMTMFGDLDVSIIREPPAGRGSVETRVLRGSEAGRVYDWVRRKLADGEQAYIVYPRLTESEELPLKAATAEAERLRTGVFHDVEVGLLHGGMTGSQKEAAMTRFRDGATKVLVATTVVEVGVDVPNATVMVIHHADRYGLSQLHQLRGRIGRGAKKSYCFLLTDTPLDEEGEVGGRTKRSAGFPIKGAMAKRSAAMSSDGAPNRTADAKSGAGTLYFGKNPPARPGPRGPAGPEPAMTPSPAENPTAQRLSILCRTTNGFLIAEEDLRLRGPGEMVGKRQHGLPMFRVADLAQDFELIRLADTDAAAIVHTDPSLKTAAHASLRRALLARYADVLRLIDVA